MLQTFNKAITNLQIMQVLIKDCYKCSRWLLACLLERDVWRLYSLVVVRLLHGLLAPLQSLGVLVLQGLQVCHGLHALRFQTLVVMARCGIWPFGDKEQYISTASLSLQGRPNVNWDNRDSTGQKFGIIKILFFFFMFLISLLCSPRLHLLDQKYSKKVILWNTKIDDNLI